MNLFKGLLFLHGYIARPDAFDGERPRYGAATVADKLDHEFGNVAASRRLFGGSAAGRKRSRDAPCLEGGCA